MNKAFVVASLLMTACAHSGRVPLAEPLTAPDSLIVTSTTFTNGTRLEPDFAFNGFGCSGSNTRPELTWTGAPVGTKSFALVEHDPDAPTGVGFFHWIVVDLPPETLSVTHNDELSAPAIVARNDAGMSAYLGPCPPPGRPHRYVFTVYALDVPTLGVSDGAGGALVRGMMAGHVLAYGRITALFAR